MWLLSLVYNDPSMWGFSRSQTVAHYGHPNLLLDPTHLFPPHKNTTSLPDMLLSHGFLWRCLNATVPTMTLSLGTEAPQCRGPVGYFSMNEGGCGGNIAVPALIHTFYLIYTQTTHCLFTQAAVHNTYGCGG